MEIIKSRDNKLIKHCRKLNIKKYRQECREFFIEGVRFVEEAVMSHVNIKYCLCAYSIKMPRLEELKEKLIEQNINIYSVEDNLLAEICDTNTPQGIAAVIGMEDHMPDNAIGGKDLLIILDRIQDPGNLGTIIRTADAAGAGGIIISEGTVDPYSSKVLRSTMGSIFHIPVVEVPDLKDNINMLKRNGFVVYASSLDMSLPYCSQLFKDRTAIIVGNEANGIEKSIAGCADYNISIPMPGKAESLNAAVAAGILMFEVIRQRSIDK